MAIVKNLNGTSDNRPPAGYSSWKEYWEEKMNRRFSLCSCTDCYKTAEIGGHVKKVNGSGEWYIVPICQEHNRLSSVYQYEVKDADMLRVRD